MFGVDSSSAYVCWRCWARWHVNRPQKHENFGATENSQATANSQAVADASSGVLQPVNIVFITLDTVRADHLHCYGNAKIKTPIIDALAKSGALVRARWRRRR